MTTLNLTLNIHKSLWLTSNKREHWVVQAKRKKQIKKDAYFTALAAIRMAGLTPPVWSEERPCAVTVAVAIPTRHLFDPANAEPSVKAALDGFTDAGMWSDDNRKVVRAVTYTSAGQRAPKGCYTLEFTIADATPAQYQEER